MTLMSEQEPAQVLAEVTEKGDPSKGGGEGRGPAAGRVFRTSVRGLVAFVHRTGDLGGRGVFRSPDRLLEGTLGHQKLRRRRGSRFEAEVPVEWRIRREGFELVVAGRVDLLRRDGDPPVVEEVKTVDRHWDGAADPMHIAQARIYAAILCAVNGWESVEVRVTYFALESGRETTIPFRLGAGELRAFLDETVRNYGDWLEREAVRLAARDEAIGRLAFPFGSFRPGQGDLARQVYRAVRDGRGMFIEAPTGLGKTMATLFPAVRALPLLEVGGRVFYATAKTSGRKAAIEALRRLARDVPDLRAIEATAKAAICFCGGRDVRSCPHAIGYHDRNRAAVADLLREGIAARGDVERVAADHRVCPHELTLDASLWCDVVVVDFNHVFDPSARLQRHFGEGGGRHVLLVDEAHNLVERSRGMHSAELVAGDLAVRGATAGGRGSGRARRALGAAREALRRVAATAGPGEDEVLDTLPRELIEACREAKRRLEDFLADQPPGQSLNGWIEPWFALAGWLRAADTFDGTCRLIVRRPAEGAGIFCADPSARLRADLEGLRCAVFFSATLSPVEYFRDLLGGLPDDEFVSTGSPFRSGQLELVVLPIDITFKARASTLGAVARAVAAHLEARPGNHLVFCPSMAYLDDLAGEVRALAGGDRLLIQSPGMDAAARASFLDAFAGPGPVTALAVIGGLFAEGVDLPGGLLTGVTVIGTGMPGLSTEREILRGHFERTLGHGFDYAFFFPGMQKVVQAAGRLIRTDADRGSLLLIDKRFNETRHRRLLPGWWPAPSGGWVRTTADHPVASCGPSASIRA
jgi:DNA excision repair protein ERCC-2